MRLGDQYAESGLIPRIIRAYREQYPGVELSINEGSAREVTEDTIEKRIDIGILRAPVGDHQSLTFHRLLNEEMLLTLPVGHALLKDRRTFVLVSSGSSRKNHEPDFLTPYLQAILGTVGIHAVDFVYLGAMVRGAAAVQRSLEQAHTQLAEAFDRQAGARAAISAGA